ncbi:MAG: sulfite exporter TauE/SafE family protein [Bacteroidota bacterium]
MEIWTGFIVGLLGSMHCVGMCGPIALALPVLSETKFKILLGRALYNFGRIVTYLAMGALFGLFGSRLVLFGLQQNISIALGAAIILYLLIPRELKSKISETILYRKMVLFLKSRFSNLISKRTNSSHFAIGLFNGLLPCGFVYVGIAGAISTGNWLSGAAYMALFGLGTFPIMFLTSILGKVINLNIRKRINKLIPVLAGVLALLFILRGLNLGIPYISPKFVYPAAKLQLQQSRCN